MAECKANETAACCCVDVGTIIDNSDCVVDFEQIYTSESEAQAGLDFLIGKARAAESEPCQITTSIEKVADGYQAKGRFEFAYQVESIIFQLSTR